MMIYVAVKPAKPDKYNMNIMYIIAMEKDLDVMAKRFRYH